MAEATKKKNYRVSEAYKDLTELSSDLIASYGPSIVELDISYNKFKDLRFLQELPKLKSLVADHNHLTSHVKIPHCASLETLWVNQNRIQNLSLFIATVAKSCPNLKILSMMKNEAAPSFFNGGDYQQYKDYRYFVISSLPNLEVLDFSRITPEEKSEALRIYPISIVHTRKYKSGKRNRKPKASS
ncbi:leucine-rich repeat-containing protein [Biomphalaria glabrata]|uniref:Leucine-rich melanocyte differentiation-associated protein-like n=1 Tax=Biomphalaria glabrata TaxID=6526 RepID=A0A2C9JFC0_BIOGL|nr:leucine-rich melanocyte differentiation-associated protein-like [Biomphalaria glabrata]XP_013067556.1 leucine-rich melanocyte differentiation-associated protein-like [Biomphalaria glabrata]XP_013067557.1 leucine-rich melanocyte differentiation-associated protein-like [Biomphalaria glabrata]XP_013067558.1 leucine-rich melanocyte differentiation-associated protein-like [Biomphalaria glabrata]KAI8772385.1 leucine-rich repeat-containing protein C10orf11 [Biomphalaria glabrata]